MTFNLFVKSEDKSAPKIEEVDSDDESDEEHKGEEAGEAGDASGKHSRSEKKARKVHESCFVALPLHHINFHFISLVFIYYLYLSTWKLGHP